MYKMLIYLLQPYTIAYVITGVAIASLWRSGEATRRGLIVVTVGFGLMLFLDLPAVSFLALGSLEWLYPPLKGSPEEGSHCRTFGEL